MKLVKQMIERLIRSVAPDTRRESLAAEDDGDYGFPLRGFDQHRVPTRYVDGLTDAEVIELNRLLRWHCFTADAHGRRFGRRSRAGKRDTPQVIPDPRILRMNERFGLAGKEVLEVGCFEGIHTIGLARLGAKVIAVDSRIENVVKTIVRTALFGCRATVFKCDLESAADLAALPRVDLVHHVGVLYHLKEPAGHLLRLGEIARHGVMLDTHFSRPEQATECYVSAGRTISYKRYGEKGRGEVFSGMYDHAKWLTMNTLCDLLSSAGFGKIEVLEERAERNGPRVLMFAARE